VTAAQAATTAADNARAAADKAQAIADKAREAETAQLAAAHQHKLALARAAAEQPDAEHPDDPANGTPAAGPETRRWDEDTQKLLTAARDPHATQAVRASVARQAALRLAENPGTGPWTRTVAESALGGDDAEAELVAYAGLDAAAEADDRDRIAMLADPAVVVPDAGDPGKLRAAAANAAAGTIEQIRSFLADPSYPGRDIDDQNAVRAVLDTAHTAGQQALADAATTALAGNVADVRALLARTQAYRQQRDDVLAVARIQVQARTDKQQNLSDAAEEALAGPAAGVRDFLDRGRHLALAKDQVAAAHIDSVEHFLTLAREAAALAAGDAADAWEAVPVALQAANRAAEQAQRARVYADQAAGFTAEARAAAQRAADSANQAADSSRKARAAADQASYSQSTATAAAQRAYRFAATARVSAQQAALSASRAAISAADAARDAAEARDAADAAYRIYYAKVAAEVRLNRANPEEHATDGSAADDLAQPALGHDLSDERYEALRGLGYTGSRRFTWQEALDFASRGPWPQAEVCYALGGTADECRPDGPLGGFAGLIYDVFLSDIKACALMDAKACTMMAAGAAGRGAKIIREAGKIGEGAARVVLPKIGDKPRKVVNSEVRHLGDDERWRRGGFPDEKTAREAVQGLGKSIEGNGFPAGTIADSSRVDRLLVPLNDKTYAVYQIKPNGNAVFKTILVKRG
jgi:hypothetical protein